MVSRGDRGEAENSKLSVRSVGYDILQLVLCVFDQERGVCSKPFREGNYAKDCAHRVWIARLNNFFQTNVNKALNSAEIIIREPLRYSRIILSSSSQFDH